METNQVKVSIVCTAYNHEKYIRRTLDGFVMQKTDFAYEAIVHDDASTDGTAAIIREYAQKYPNIIKPIFQSVNQYSRNVSITKDIIKPIAKGKYIAHCEGDDYWTDPQKLQKQVDFLDNHPEYSGTAHNCIIVDQEDNPIESIYPMYRRYRSHRYTLKRFSRDVVYPGQTATLVYRKSADLFESKEQEVAFNAIRIGFVDKRIMLKLLTMGDIYCFEEPMSAYRIVTSSGDSWSAANYGKNRSHLLHVASIDFRKYVNKWVGKPFWNHYTTFRTGVASIVKYLLKPTSDNKEAYQCVVQEHGGLIGSIAYLLGIGIVSIPLYFVREAEKRKYDPRER